MSKNLAIGLLVIVVLAETAYIGRTRLFGSREEAFEATPALATLQANTPPAPRPLTRPMKGDNLSASGVSAYAYQVYPTMDTTPSAKNAFIGWDVRVQKNKDGSAVVSMLPKRPDEPTSSYTVKPGNLLYFVEMNTGDDGSDTGLDNNPADDYGLIVDSSGIVQ